MGCLMGTKAREENHCRTGVKSGLAAGRATKLKQVFCTYAGRPRVPQTWDGFSHTLVWLLLVDSAFVFEKRQHDQVDGLF